MHFRIIFGSFSDHLGPWVTLAGWTSLRIGWCNTFGLAGALLAMVTQGAGQSRENSRRGQESEYIWIYNYILIIKNISYFHGETFCYSEPLAGHEHLEGKNWGRKSEASGEVTSSGDPRGYSMIWYGLIWYVIHCYSTLITLVHISDDLENCLVMFGGDAAIFWSENSERYQVLVAVQKDKIPNARDGLCNIFNHPKRVAVEVQSLNFLGLVDAGGLRRAGSAGS